MHSRGLVLLLLCLCLRNYLSEPKERLRRKGILQVLNRPKDQRSRPRTEWHPPDSASSTALNSDQSRSPPLLSFPGSQPKTPLLDFPDPVAVDEAILDFPDHIVDLDQCRVDTRQAEHPKVDDVRNRSGKLVRRAIEFQNRQLLQYIVRKAIEPSPSVPIHSPKYGLMLLNATVEIFKNICPKRYLPVYFIENTHDLFKQLHFLTSRGGTEYLKTDDFESILQILSACLRKGPLPVKYFGDACSEEILSYASKSKTLCPPVKDGFDPTNFDPLTDIIWHMYNAVQSRCFSSFHANYRMFHKYGMSMLDLLSTPIKRRWNHVSPEQGFPFPARILGPHFDLYLRNIARCTQYAMLSSALQARRPRYLFPGTTRLNYNRSVFPRLSF